MNGDVLLRYCHLAKYEYRILYNDINEDNSLEDSHSFNPILGQFDTNFSDISHTFKRINIHDF